ncbi:MAG TPA: hypothetical protein VJG13_15315 [Thermoanaerobaculia bacterium]|nr:hypothetical protein [Thermoanaerobaculia bacterium]
MRDENRKRIERWLEAGAPEAAGPELEAAWSVLLRELPEEAPSPAFVAAVLQRVAEVRGAARDLAPRWRLALAAGLALFGLSALALPAVLLAVPLRVGGLVAVVGGAIKAVAGWAAQGIEVWQALASFAGKVTLVVATPQATLAMASFAVLSALALRLLFELTLHDRRSAGVAAR